MIGRQESLDALLGHASAVSRGEGRALIVSGSRGVGKTRLVEELGQRLRPEYAWGHGTCDRPSPGAGTPLFDALERAGGAELVAQVRGAGSLATALRSALESLGARRPTALAIEDLQLADAATLRAVELLCHAGVPNGVLLIVTCRPSRALAGFGTLAVHLPLKPLVSGDARSLVRALAPGLKASSFELLTDWAPLLTGGNPLYTTYAVRWLEASEVLSRSSDGTVALNREKLQHLRAPDSVDDALDLLVGALSSDTRSVVSAAAMIGRKFGVDTLAELGFDSRKLLGELDEAVETGVCLRDQGAEQYRFEHNSVRRRLLKQLGRPEARELHERVARYFEDRNIAPGARAHHWDRAGDPQRAGAAHLEARDLAAAIGAGAEARAHADRARRLLSDCGRDRALSGRFGPAIPVLEQACALGEELGAIADLARSRSLLAICLAFAGEHRRATALCERARDVAERADAPELMLPALCATSALGEAVFDWELGIRAGSDALSLASHHRLGGVWLYLATLFTARAHFRLGHLGRARSLLRRAAEVADEHEVTVARGWAHAYGGDIELADGRLGDAVHQYRLAIECNGHDEYSAPLGLIGLAHAAAMRGTVAQEVHGCAREALVRLRAARNRRELAHALQRHAESLELIGMAREAVDVWQKRESVFDELDLELCDWWPPGYQTSRPRVDTEIIEEDQSSSRRHSSVW